MEPDEVTEPDEAELSEHAIEERRGRARDGEVEPARGRRVLHPRAREDQELGPRMWRVDVPRGLRLGEGHALTVEAPGIGADTAERGRVGKLVPPAGLVALALVSGEPEPVGGHLA